MATSIIRGGLLSDLQGKQWPRSTLDQIRLKTNVVNFKCHIVYLNFRKLSIARQAISVQPERRKKSHRGDDLKFVNFGLVFQSEDGTGVCTSS